MSSSSSPHILITGGAGYIGSHTIVVLLENRFRCTVVDSLINSCDESLNRVRNITGCGNDQLVFIRCDLCNRPELEKVFIATDGVFDACIHFAGLKSVNESVKTPLLYYENNIVSTINLLGLLDKYGCHRLVFSSSATVYGSVVVPITEETQTGTGITNPYGRTKFMIEAILKDFKGSDWSITTLRYFNPVGAHPSGLIGENPTGVPNNLMPYIADVAMGIRPVLTIYGGDYPTHDGTGVRDYIHVMDLAEGHVSALRHMWNKTEYNIYNMGSGTGYSVLDMVKAMSKASGKSIPYNIGPRRMGDVAICYADTQKAETELGWRSKLSLDEICADLWKWRSYNPNGYATK